MIEHMDIAYAPSPTPQQQQQPSNQTENNIENPLANIPTNSPVSIYTLCASANRKFIFAISQ